MVLAGAALLARNGDRRAPLAPGFPAGGKSGGCPRPGCRLTGCQLESTTALRATARTGATPGLGGWPSTGTTPARSWRVASEGMLDASPPIAPTTDAVIICGDLGRLAHQEAPLAGAWAGCVPIASLSPTPAGMVTPSRPATPECGSVTLDRARQPAQLRPPGRGELRARECSRPGCPPPAVARVTDPLRVTARTGVTGLGAWAPTGPIVGTRPWRVASPRMLATGLPTTASLPPRRISPTCCDLVRAGGLGPRRRQPRRMTPAPSPTIVGARAVRWPVAGRQIRPRQTERARRNNFDQRDSGLGRLVPYRPARAAPMPPAWSWGWQARGRPQPDWRPLPGCCVAKCHQPLRSTGQADLTPDWGDGPRPNADNPSGCHPPSREGVNPADARDPSTDYGWPLPCRLRLAMTGPAPKLLRTTDPGGVHGKPYRHHRESTERVGGVPRV